MSHIDYFDTVGSLVKAIKQNQQTNQTTHSHSNVVSLSYTEPVGLNKVIEFNYAYTLNHNTSDKVTYNFDPYSLKYDDPNFPLTNEFENTYKAHRVGANYRVQNKKYNYQIGLGIQQSQQENNTNRKTNLGSDSSFDIKSNYTNFFPTASFNLTPSRSKNLRFTYNGRTNQPSVSQLQPVTDVTDTLNVKVGNPNLSPEFTHNFNLNYNTFNILTFRYVAANLSFNTTQDKIISDITTKGPQQITSYANVNGAFRASGFFTLGLPFKNQKWKGSSVNLTNNTSYSRDISMIRHEKTNTNTFTLSQGAGLNLNKEKFDVGLRANIAYNKITSQQNPDMNDDYFTHTYSLDFSYTFLKTLIVSSDFDYVFYAGRSDGYNTKVPLWNASVRKQVFKEKC